MATMSVSMNLTLVDSASAPLRAFTALVEALEAAVSKLNPRIQAAVDSLNAMGVAAAKAGGGFESMVAAMAKATAGVESMSAATAKATTGFGTMGAAASETGAAVGEAAAKFEVMVTSMSAVATRAAAAAASMLEVGAASKIAATEAATATGAMETGFARMNTQASGLSTTLKGLGELWAAMEIEKGLKSSVQDAIAMQNTQNRLKTMNVSGGDQANMMTAAADASKAIPQFNENEMLSMLIDLRNATGSVSEAIHMIQPFAEAAFNMKMATPNGKFSETDMLLVAKSLEQRNATMDPAKMQEELDMISKIYAGTQGRVNAQQILGNLQYSRGGLGQSLETEFMPFMAAMIEQIKSGGGNGGQVGTGLTAMQRYVLGNVKNGTSAKEANELGLIDPGKTVWNSQGNINLKQSDLTMAGSEEFQRNPYKWVQDYLKPAMIRAGIDLTNDAAVNKTLTALFPSGTANSTATTMVNRGALLEKDAGNINQVLDNKGQYAENVKTATANIEAFKAQLENLAIVMGTTLLPALTLIAKGFTTAFEGIADFFRDHPIAAQFATWAAAITAVGLALAGFVAILGLASLGLGAFTAAEAGAGAAAAGAALGAGAASTTFASMVAAMASWAPVLIGLAELVVVFIAAWKFGELLGSIDVFGKNLQERMTDLIEWVVNAFASGWKRVGDIIASAFPAAAAAEARGAAGSANPFANRPIDPVNGTSWDNPFANRAIDFGNRGGWDDAKKSASPSSAASSGGGSTGSNRFKNFNPVADQSAEDLKVEENALRNQIKVLDALYKSGKETAQQYYDDKQRALDESIGKEIASLAKERAALMAAPQVDQAKVNRVDSTIAQKVDTYKAASTENEEQLQTRFNVLKQKELDIDRLILEAEGKKREVQVAKTLAKLQDDRASFIANPNAVSPDAVAKVDEAISITKIQGDYERVANQIKTIQTQTKADEQDVTAAVKNGLMTQYDGENQVYGIRQKEAVQIRDLIDLLHELMAASDAPEAVKAEIEAKIASASSQSKAALDSLSPAAKQLSDISGNALSKFVNGMLSGTMTIRSAFQSMLQALGQGLSQWAADSITQMLKVWAQKKLLEASGGGGLGGASSGGGGMFGSLASLFGGSGAASAGTNVAADTLASSAAGFAADGIVPFLASGTDYVPQDMLAYIHKGEKVVPAEYNTKQHDANSRPMSVTNHFTVQGGTSRETQTQIAYQASLGLTRASRRNA